MTRCRWTWKPRAKKRPLLQPGQAARSVIKSASCKSRNFWPTRDYSRAAISICAHFTISFGKTETSRFRSSAGNIWAMRAKCQGERLSEPAPGDLLFHVFQRFLALFTNGFDVKDRADDAD